MFELNLGGMDKLEESEMIETKSDEKRLRVVQLRIGIRISFLYQELIVTEENVANLFYVKDFAKVIEQYIVTFPPPLDKYDKSFKRNRQCHDPFICLL